VKKCDYKYILFDLDGTLTDPAVGVTNSIMYALKRFNISVSNRKDLYKFIGPPLWDSFKKYYNFSEKQSQKAVEYYREYYKDKGIFENKVYPGIAELLENLKSSGKILVVATSKPTVFAKQILEYFDIMKYFSYVSGSNLDGTRVNKDEVIAYALEKCKITDLEKAIMIGDREHDIIGAQKTGIDSMGVLFGYGNRNELECAGANYIADTVEDISTFLN